MAEDVHDPAVCLVRLNRIQTMVWYLVFLAVLATFAWIVQTFCRRYPLAYGYGLAVVGLTFAFVTLRGFRHWNRPCYQADETGVYDGHSGQTIPWQDVVAVERFDHPRPEPDDWHFGHLPEERWSVVLTVRDPRRYLTGMRKLFYAPDPAAGGKETAQVWLQFGGIEPRSRELYHCIQHHLALRDAREKRTGPVGS